MDSGGRGVVERATLERARPTAPGDPASSVAVKRRERLGGILSDRHCEAARGSPIPISGQYGGPDLRGEFVAKWLLWRLVQS